MTRGKRNKNPFNIRRGSSRWLGLSSEQNDREFCQFQSYAYGLRAGLYLLCRYYFDFGCHTVESLVNRFAPPSENDTDHYIYLVGKESYLFVHSNFELTKIKLFLISTTICRVESSYYLMWKEFCDSFDMLPIRFKNKFK